MKWFLAAVVAVLASPIAAQDFYGARLRAGEAALAAGQTTEAVDDLRIASFGLLGQPALLCEALVNLAVAQNLAGRATDAAATLGRYADALRAAPACREARLEPARRNEFEALARKLLPHPVAQDLLALQRSPAPAAVPSPSAPVAPPPTARPRSVPPPSVLPTPVAAASEELDREPQLKTTTRAVYPESARRAGVGGVVLLRVLVAEDGSPQRVEIARGVQPDLDQAAVAAVRHWLFEPGRKGGRAMTAWMTVAVPFEASQR